MTTPLDTAVLLGVESTYGTAAALTHAVEAQTDPWQREVAYLESAGFRSGMHTLRAQRRKTILMGATGSIEVDLFDRGMGFLVQSLLGTTTGPTVTADTSGSVYESVHTSDPDPSDLSYTVQVLRAAVGGNLVPFTYLGAVPVSWTLSHEVEGLLGLTVDFDATDEVTTEAAGTPVYSADADTFGWHEAVITIGGTQVDATAFEFSAGLGMKTDRRFIRGNAQKKKPLRNALPTYEGSVSCEFENTNLYDDFVAGTLQPLVATWTGASLGTSSNYKVELSLGAIQFSGESPNASLEDVTMQNLPFRVLHNDTDPAVQLTLTNDDATF